MTYKIFQKMLRRISAKLFSLDLIKKTLWNVVLYFIYFSTLLFWMRLIGVNAQGNRGVIINNQKIDDSSGIHNLQSQQIFTSIPTKIISSSTSQVIYFIVKASKEKEDGH